MSLLFENMRIDQVIKFDSRIRYFLSEQLSIALPYNK